MSDSPDDVRVPDGHILIVGVDDAPAGSTEPILLGGRTIPIDAVSRNMSVVVGQVGEIVGAADAAAGGGRIEYIDVELSIEVDGSIGLLGTGARAATRGTFTVRFRLDGAESD